MPRHLEGNPVFLPHRLSQLPISVPAWMGVLFAAMIIFFAVVTGSFAGFALVMLTAMFSFQFWCYAIWRGLARNNRIGKFEEV